MSNTFNFKRFWNYFTYDLISAKNNTGLSLAIAGAAPVFTYAIYQIFALLFDGKTAYMPSGVKIAAIVIAVFISILYFPTKQYGSLTDKRAGADWLMLPASRLEKWFSLLLITCLVVPAFLFAELFATAQTLKPYFRWDLWSLRLQPNKSLCGPAMERIHYRGGWKTCHQRPLCPVSEFLPKHTLLHSRCHLFQKEQDRHDFPLKLCAYYSPFYAFNRCRQNLF